LAALFLPAAAPAADMGHEGMQGMKMESHGMAGGQDMMKMGDKVFTGKIGPWTGEARIMDMKASMEASGMKAHGAMMNSHHISIAITDPKTKAPLAEGKGTVTVTGPDKGKAAIGADINLPKPGKYALDVEIESGGKKGNATFSYTVK
jgi:RNA polymerase subunit RPABC4/transcription elongation factor Spt4